MKGNERKKIVFNGHVGCDMQYAGWEQIEEQLKAKANGLAGVATQEV